MPSWTLGSSEGENFFYNFNNLFGGFLITKNKNIENFNNRKMTPKADPWAFGGLKTFVEFRQITRYFVPIWSLTKNKK